MSGKEVFCDNYFSEINPKSRQKLLNQYSETYPQDTNIQLYQKLWKLRYTDPKNSKQNIDSFLWQIVNVICLYRVSKHFSRGTEKEINTAMDSLGFSFASEYGKTGNDILYLEFRNAAKRYFGTCDSKAYGKKFMGIVSMKDDERTNKVAREVWQLTEGLPQKFNTDEKMELFCKAVHDEFICEYSDGEKHLNIQRDKHKKKRTLHK